MTTQTKNPMGLHVTTVQPAASSSIPHLIFLIPDVRVDAKRLEQAIVRLGVDRSHELILIGKTANGAVAAQSKFYRLGINLRATGWNVTTQLLKAEEDWITAVRRAAQSGDLIVCHAEHDGERLRREISLQAGVTVYVLAGLYPTRSNRWLRAAARLGYEIIPLAIVAMMFWFQFQISEQTSGLVNTIALSLSVIVEVALIFVWSLFIPRDQHDEF